MANTGTIETILRDEILGRVAGRLKIPVSELLKPNRCERRTAEARQIAMYLLYNLNGKSLTRAGAVMNRDRTTVRYAVSKVESSRRLSEMASQILVSYKNAASARIFDTTERVDAPNPGQSSV